MRSFPDFRSIIPIFILCFVHVNRTSAQENMIDLSNLFDKNYILQDTNQDSVIDVVDVKIIVSEKPSPAEIVSAANISARLGFETTAMNLDLVEERSKIKASKKPAILLTEESKYTKGLAPGQGRILFIPPEKPDQGLIIVSGADDSGLIAAANYFAGRYPNIWTLKKKTLSDVRGKIANFIAQEEITVRNILVKSVDVDLQNPGIIKLLINLYTDQKEDIPRLRKILTRPDSTEEKKKIKLNDLKFTGIHKIAVTIISPETTETVYLLNDKKWTLEQRGRNLNFSKKPFTLSRFYTLDGIFQDENKDFIPDQMIASISIGDVESAKSLANLTARIGLEGACVRLPLVRIAGEEDHPERFGFPVLFGQNHFQIEELKKQHKIVAAPHLKNAGSIQFVPKAFGKNNAIVITAGKPANLEAITNYAAKKLPYLWDYGKGNFLLADIEREVTRFFQMKKGAGQVAFALQKLETWLKRLKDEPLDSVAVELCAENTPQILKNYIQGIVNDHFDDIDVKIELYPTGFGSGKQIFKDEIEFPWEVDDFWKFFNQSIYPAIKPDSKGAIEVLVSESPEIRQSLTQKIEQKLRAKKVKPGAIDVNVLSAYKQGFSWLYDEVLPKIRNRDISRIEITYHTLERSKEIRWQTINANTRWLQEIYPIDAVLAKELNLPDSLITFHPTQKSDPIYRIDVFDKVQKLIFSDSYNPKYVVRPFFDLFPDYESVRVTTGWVSAEIDGEVVVDQRIKTDAEKFWDYLQTVSYQKLIDYVMDIQNGKPSSSNAPYFDEFKVNLCLSEPNYSLGIDEEVISSAEALHEDIYFETLTLFNLIGGRYGAGSMNFPGRIIPLIQPPQDGLPGRAIIELTGKEKAQPKLVFTYWKRGDEAIRQEYHLNDLRIPAPKLSGIWVQNGKNSVSQLMFDVTARDSVDRYEEYKHRSTEQAIDRTFTSIETLTGMIETLHKLHQSGIFSDRLSYDKVDNLLFRISLEDSVNFVRYADLPMSERPKSTETPEVLAKNYHYQGERLVQWNTPLSPLQTENILAKLNTFPGITTYFTTRSFLNQPVFVMDVLPPTPSNYISQTKLTALKPTLFISGRQHANEVSSTSHILRLAELCASDSLYSGLIKKVNLVLQPITNIDGAKLGIELHKVNPHFMLHAAYLGALGVDVDRGLDHYPESRVRQMIRESWLPDVYLNPHGYPSHEWVQYFAGYSAWVRDRKGGQRSWWSPRGWFIPGFRWIEDKKYPDHKTVAFAILDSIAKAITSLPEVMDVNQRMYKRYKKYGSQDRENFREYFYKDILVNASLKGRKLTDNKITGPKVTYFSLTTEAPDETASGDWLQMVCRAGLAHTTAVLKYLARGKNRIVRDSKEGRYGVTRSVFRKRPVLPGN